MGTRTHEERVGILKMAYSSAVLASGMSVIYASATVTRTSAGCDYVLSDCYLVLVISTDIILPFVGADFSNGFTSRYVFFAWVIYLCSLIIHVS